MKPLTRKFPNDLLRSNTFRMNYFTASDTRKTSAATWSCSTDVKTTSGGKEISTVRCATLENISPLENRKKTVWWGWDGLSLAGSNIDGDIGGRLRVAADNRGQISQ